jgi:hypothetical protein
VLVGLPKGVGGLALLLYLFVLFVLFCFVLFFIFVYFNNEQCSQAPHQVHVGSPPGARGSPKGLLALLFYFIFITRTRCSYDCPKGLVALLFILFFILFV